jgi:hypothetical protein
MRQVSFGPGCDGHCLYLPNIVNRRSWVYQERMLAPRILHWCKDQIAFECKSSKRAELRPEGLPHFLLKTGTVTEDTRLKSADVEEGKRLWHIRQKSSNRSALQRMVDEADSAKNIDDKFYLYELWKHWVESYSKMELTNSEDRLLALSGVAEMLNARLKETGTPDKYVAGLWQNFSASQLLWHVNQGEGENRQPLENTRPAEYRAPSFSWAAVESPRGITMGETTDENLLVDVAFVRLIYRTTQNKFGLLEDGYIVLRGVLRKIELIDDFRPVRGPLNDYETFVSILRNY